MTDSKTHPWKLTEGGKSPVLKCIHVGKTLELSAIGDMCMISKPYLE